jgi:multidrug resistance efflux pump
MSNDVKKKSAEMSDFQLASILTRLDNNLSNLSAQVSEVIRDFKEVHKDHENRIRGLESNSATKAEIKRAHDRVDKLQATVWKVIVYLAAGGTVTGGGIAAVNYLGG